LVIFYDEFRALNLCEFMGWLNFMKLLQHWNNR